MIKSFGKLLGVFCVVVAFVAVLSIATPAGAEMIQLGFILDSSGSIGSSNWNIIRTGLANAVLSEVPLAGVDTYEISVVTFSNLAYSNISNFMVTDAISRTALSNQISLLPYLGSTTNFADAFTKMRDALDNTIVNAAHSYVNFATDGVQNVGGTGIAERNNLITAGVDNISIEGIGSGVDATDLRNNFCYPGPCDNTIPFNFPANGFYIGVANAQGYADAIGGKIQVVVNPVPEPGTLVLFGIGLAGLLGFRRRK